MREELLFRDEEALKAISRKDFAEAANLLLEDQKKEWSLAYTGYYSLSAARAKVFQFNQFKIKVQFNAGRINSSAAKVDPKSIKERKCFLCVQNLPDGQRALPYESDYLILVNPFPIFPEHFTIPHLQHIPQRIEGAFSQLLSLSKDLGKKYTVFYNGPKCGASAPDHLHFQAGTKGFMPIDNEFNILRLKFGTIIFEEPGLRLTAINDGLRKIIAIEGIEKEKLAESFNKFYSQYYKTSGSPSDEPMMNIISSYANNEWRVLIFMRQKHRPSHYFAEGDDNILLSPASVDIGGVCITPLEKDFDKITQQNVVDIFNEVSINDEVFNEITDKLKQT